MSGPKVDVAAIREQEKKRLAEAREKRLGASDNVAKLLERVQNSLGGNGECEEKLKQLREETMKELKKLHRTIKLGNELLDVDSIMGKAKSLVREYETSVKAQLGLVQMSAVSNREFKQLEASKHTIERIRQKEFVLGKEEEETVNIVTEADVKVQEELFVAEINRVMQSDEIPKKGKKTLLVLHQDLQELVDSELPAERKAKRISRMLEEFEKTVNLMQRELEGMQAVYAEYCRELFDSAEEPRSISEFDSVEALKEAIKEVREAAAGRVSKEYIRRQIDEVMKKHGYDVVRSDMLESVTESGQILYGVDSETAINVFVSEESQVTMRVVGIGFDSQITGEEDERLFQQQCAFCSLHPQITKELEMRGVILHTKKHMPPDKKFNKKIQTREKTDNQTQSRAKRELKRTEKKVMHRE